MYSIGIDSGSTATKGVLYKNNKILDYVIVPTGWSPKKTCENVLDTLLKKVNAKREEVKIVATGYGRVAITFADKTITEITCHAKGAHFLNSNTKTIIDIGGQDSKVISIDVDGNVTDFMMNDKCAAGTGRFLEVMINLLGSDISDLDTLTKNAKPQSITSMCTVFAESEVISLLANGASKESVAAGIISSIVNKTSTLVNKLNVTDEILFTGGLAQSNEIANALSKKLNKQIHTSQFSQFAGAIGAAVIGWNKFCIRR
ncbi:acyl-CoA dehydratase activase [Haloimpatiens sp. FM7330]|uniref:acyl-CoA dehydratase activase n=1 Tax=Haloimpatiens sp. FM7330 TaxID=3298610 RepID=UPI00362B8929